MNIFSTKFINLFSIIITIFIFLIFNFFINNFYEKNINKNYLNQSISSDEISEKNQDFNNQDIKNISEKNTEKINKNDLNNWYLQIEKINLKAPIKETVELEVLNDYIGHFEDTAITEGNIGLAAHNRGYKNNYFENLKNLKKGDEIIYKYNDFYGTYIIDKIEIIRNTDWSYLENTKENRITLITCTENRPEYRLCVQAVKNNK